MGTPSLANFEKKQDMFAISLFVFALFASLARAEEYFAAEPQCDGDQQEGIIETSGQNFNFQLLTPSTTSIIEVCVIGDFGGDHESAAVSVNGGAVRVISDNGGFVGDCRDDLQCE